MYKKTSAFIFSLVYFFNFYKISFGASVISIENNSENIYNIDLDTVTVVSFFNGSQNLDKANLSDASTYGNSYNNTENTDIIEEDFEVLKIYDLVDNFNKDLKSIAVYDLDGNKKTYISANEEVSLVEKFGDWIGILYKNTEYFINANEISVKETVTYAKVISQNGLNLRKEASTSSEIIKVLNYGENVKIIENLGDWAYIEDSSGKAGYLSTEYIEEVTKNEKNEVLSAEASEIIEYAKQFLGNPYVYGGQDLETGTDCSGFIYLIFKNFGIELPRISREQYYVGEFVEKEDLIPGDLVFFSSGDENNISHIGIYIGNNEYIHSSDEKYGVIISSLDNPYSIKYYFGAKRIL